MTQLERCRVSTRNVEEPLFLPGCGITFAIRPGEGSGMWNGEYGRDMAHTKTAHTNVDENGTEDLGKQVLEAALALAEERGWNAVRLHDVAERLGIPPDRILEHYSDLDGVADAWFRRGWEAMIAPKASGFAALPARQRVEICMLAWFDLLAAHRRVTIQMLRGKMHLPHPHHWSPMIFNLSRTIHWLREAAMLPATYGTRRAQIEEIGLTGLFVATLWVWGRDDTLAQQRTRRFLRNRLDHADRLMTCLWGPGHPPAETQGDGRKIKDAP